MSNEIIKQKKTSTIKDTVVAAILLVIAVMYMIQSNLKVREPWETDLPLYVFVIPICVYLLSFVVSRWLFFFTVREVDPNNTNILRKITIAAGIVYVLLWVWILAVGMMHFNDMLTEHSFADRSFLYMMKYMSSMPNKCVLLFLGVVAALAKS